jgi:hypothetical protein
MQILRDCEYSFPQNAREPHLIHHLRWNQHKTDFFNNPECVMQLTKSLLKLDFELKLELPDDRLCPPVSFISFLDASCSLTRLTGPKSTQLFTMAERPPGQHFI